MAGAGRKDHGGLDAKASEQARGGAVPDGGSPDQQVMEMLAGFEERLAELRRLWDEHRTAEAKLKEKEAAFLRREAEHAAIVEAFERRVAAADEARAEFEERAGRLRAAEEAAQQKLAELEAERRQVAQQAQDAESRAREAAAQLETARAQSEAAAAERESLSKREEELRQTTAQIAEIERNSGQAREEAQRRAASAEEELRSALSDRDTLAIELTRREELQAALEAQIEKARVQEQEHAAAAGALKGEVDGLTAQIASQRVELETLRLRAADADKPDPESQRRVEQLEGRLRERDEALERAADELREAREQAGTARGKASAAEIDQLKKELEAAQSELVQRRSDLEAAGDEARTLRERLAELERQAAEFNARLEEARAQAAQTGDTEEVLSLRSELERTKGELAIAVESCDRAHSELKKAQARAARQASGAGVAPVFARDASRLEQRRHRLNRVKSLQREQSNKIRVASEALRKRLEQCEQILGLRSELSQARQALEQAHKRVQRQRGVSRMAAALLSIAVVFAMLGGLSWVVAGQMWPGTYVATAAIQATARGRELTPEERRDWQTYHETLVADPRFIEKAAEHFGKRGITTLAEPGQLTKFLKSHLNTRSPGDGALNFELKSEGAERTARLLDTVVTALAGEANQARSKRIDGGTTDISQPASASGSPIDDTRLRHAGMLWGGSSIAFAILGLVVWGRLAAAKLRYEGQLHVEHVLEAERWPAIPGLGPARPTGSPVPSTGGRAR